MPTVITATTELEAVNVMLGTIGESPVNSLGGDNNVDVAAARKLLNEILKETLAEGWAFNTEYDWPLLPDQNSEIVAPGNAIRIDADQHPELDLVIRGTKLYDRKAHTFTFTKQIKVSMLIFLPFEEIPEAARRYITIRAARIFQDRGVGSDTLHQLTEADEIRARALLKGEEGDTADHNIFQGYDSARMLYRGPGRRYY